MASFKTPHLNRPFMWTSKCMFPSSIYSIAMKISRKIVLSKLMKFSKFSGAFVFRKALLGTFCLTSQGSTSNRILFLV